MDVLKCMIYFIEKLPRQFTCNNGKKKHDAINPIHNLKLEYGNVTSNKGYCNRPVWPGTR